MKNKHMPYKTDKEVEQEFGELFQIHGDIGLTKQEIINFILSQRHEDLKVIKEMMDKCPFPDEVHCTCLPNLSEKLSILLNEKK